MSESLGQRAEEMVAGQYEKAGYRILDRNFRQSKGRQIGELDIVATKRNELVLVEVKARTGKLFGSAVEAVDLHKQIKLVKMAKLYLLTHPQFSDYDIRIDVAAVDIDNSKEPVIILENAIGDFD